MKKAVVITGVSSGIGFDAARAMIARGHRLFGSVRRQPMQNLLAPRWGGDFTPLLFDVTDRAAIIAAADQVQAELGGQSLTALVK
jgi:NADP-dependent 3-hydroxy acid dehydrogenase YdfG